MSKDVLTVNSTRIVFFFIYIKMLQSNQYYYCLNVCFKAHDMLQFTSDASANGSVVILLSLNNLYELFCHPAVTIMVHCILK